MRGRLRCRLTRTPELRDANGMAGQGRAGSAAPRQQSKSTARAAKVAEYVFPGNQRRIVLLHLDSLVCLPGLDYLIAAWKGRIAGVVSSDRLVGASGFFRQLQVTLAQSGLRMMLALGFDIVAVRVASFCARPLRHLASCLGFRERFYTLREHASRMALPYLNVRDVNSAPNIEAVRQLKPDLIVSFHFDQILRPTFLAAVGCPVINVHPAMLPAHRGPCPAFWTLAGGDESCGVTIHLILDAAIDAGPVILRREQPLQPGLCMGELDERLFVEGARALVSLVNGTSGLSISDAVGPKGKYESFPDASTVHAARRRGVRLWRLKQAVRLIGAMIGWRRRSAD